MVEFKTTHNLEFLARVWVRDENYAEFKVGTCEGLYNTDDLTYNILAITNNEPGNGHFEDVLQWFENSCRRDRKGLQVQEIHNQKFLTHLIEKRGFSAIPWTNNVVKFFV